jgi:lysophospholipase L1-like esterase
MPNTPKPVTTLSDLMNRAEAGTLGKLARERFFSVDEARSRPFSPAIRLNAETVDLEGARPSLPEVTELLNKAVSGEAAKKAAKATASAKFKLPIYSEGDSWFNLPDFPVPSGFPPVFKRYPPDAIDVLDKTFEAKPNNTAIWGDTLKNMTKPANGVKQYLQKLGGGRFRHFLISGGGNDILADISANLVRRKTGDTNPAGVAKYVKPEFDARVKKLIAYYKTIHTDVTTKIADEIIIYVHGYGNCFPLPGGEYLGGPLKTLDFDPAKHPAMARAVVAELVDRFNVALAGFASTHARVVYIDMRPSLPDLEDWNWDEIHPSKQGAGKVAAQFKTAINQNSFLS